MPEISWFFILLVLVAFGLKNKNHKMFINLIIIGIILFLLFSTSYLPKKLINSIEKTHTPIELIKLDSTKTYYIYVLGAGTSTDSRLPETMNLNTTSLARLVEGIRIYKHLKHAVLVTSAATEDERVSQASLSKAAAVSLGVNEQNIQMLETPTSTLEEALAFKDKFGTSGNLILVTSALHMPRAVEIFSDQGIRVIPAPTEYLYKEDRNSYMAISFPSSTSIALMDSYLMTLLKHLYYRGGKKK